MSSTVKNPWRLVAGTFIFSIVLIVLPHLVFKRDIAAVDRDFWYYIVFRLITFIGFVIAAYETVKTREVDGSGYIRALTIAIAAIYFIITIAGAAQYRSDKGQGIQYDKATSQAAKIGAKSWNI